MNGPSRLQSIKDLPAHRGRLVIDLGGIDFHMNFQPAGSASADTLLIGFHGNIDRPNRPTPAFIPFLPDIGGDVHQLTVADPSLRTDPDISTSWFSGDWQFDAQSLFPQFFQSTARALGARRTIYFGTSSGGFAALLYSWRHSGSLALVGNPQTRIADFYPRHVGNYLRHCWPGVEAVADLEGRVVTDLAKVYAQGEIDNHVIYLQNSTDHYHLHGQMAPFLAAIRNPGSRARIATACGFPGRLGHSPVWQMFVPWLKAAVLATDWKGETLITTHGAITAKGEDGATAPALARPAPGTAGPHSAADLRMATLLRDYHLRPTAES